jgi:hypothetical protein
MAVLLAGAACGYGTSAAFNADGSVTVGLKFLFPTSLMQSGSGASVQGMTPADISKANAEVAAKYPGGKVTAVTEGDESGALVTIPFKTERDAFAFMTQPTKLSPSGATSGSASGLDLANTGGLFASATHTTSGQTDTYTFKTLPPTMASPSPGSQSVVTNDELASIFTINFSLSVPHEITSAPGALFTLDRKTAIWKLSWTKSETLSATTGPGVGLVALAGNSVQGQSPALVIGVGLAAIAFGFIVGMFAPWRRLLSPGIVPSSPPAGVEQPPISAPPASPILQSETPAPPSGPST